MSKKIYLCLAVALAATAIPNTQAAPDTPPGLTWEIGLPEPPTDTCNQFSPQETQIRSVRVGKDGYIYTAEACNENPTDSFVVRRITPSGGIVWTQVFDQPLQDLSFSSIDVDPDNRVWVWYDDPGQETQTRFLAVFDKFQTLDFVQSNAQFSNSNSVGRTSFEEIDADTFRAYAGGAASRIAYECTSKTSCTKLYDLGGNPGAAAYHASPYFDTLYGWDGNIGGSVSQVSIVNQASGLFDDTEQAPFAGADGRLFYNPSTDTLAMGYGKVISGQFTNQYMEWNKTTLASVRDVTPIEDRPNGPAGGLTVPLDTFIDGEGSAFYCGLTQSGTDSLSYLAKFNTTVNMGQRWNITYSKVSGLGNQDTARSCDLSPDGSIYIGTEYCQSLDSQCSSVLRKYAGAAVGREQDTIFEGYTSSSTTTGPIGEGPIADMVDFFNDAWGFDGSWLFGLAIVGMVVFPARNARPLYVALMAFIGVGICVALGLFPMWLIFVLVFLVIAVAGFRMFEGADQE